MASKSLLLILFLTLFIFAVAQEHADQQFDPNNRFFVPPPAEKDVLIDPTVFSRNEVYTVGQPKTFTWTTDAQNIRLVMLQQGISGNLYELASMYRHLE